MGSAEYNKQITASDNETGHGQGDKSHVHSLFGFPLHVTSRVDRPSKSASFLLGSAGLPARPTRA